MKVKFLSITESFTKTKIQIFGFTNFPGSFFPYMDCCMNSCMFRRHYEGKVLHFDKDLKSKDQRLKKGRYDKQINYY